MKFGEVVRFKIVPFVFQIDQDDLFSYFCNEITMTNNKKYFKKTNQYIGKYLNYLNTNIIYERIKIPLKNNEEYPIDLRLNELKVNIKQFIAKYIYTDLFKQIKATIKEFIVNKFKLPISVNSKQGEINLKISFEIPLDEFSISLNIDQVENPEFFYFKSSHFNVNEFPLIFCKDYTQVVYFNQLGKVNLEKMISNKIKEFEKIYTNLIYEKCRNTIKGLFLPIKIIINDENSKINFLYDNTFLLFSIFVDVKGKVQICNENFVFKNDIQKEILERIINFLKFNDYSALIFNEIIFENFLYCYFNLNNLNVIYDKVKINNYSNTMDFKLTFLLLENKFVSKKCLINFDISLFTNNKVKVEKTYLSVTNYNDDLLYYYELTELPDFKKLQKDNKFKMNKTTNFNSKILSNFYSLVITFNNVYEELLKNLIESLSIVSNLSINNNLSNIVIDIEKSKNEISVFIDKDNIDLLTFFFKEIQILNKNLIVKLLLNQDNIAIINQKFLYAMTSYSVFDNDNIINFNNKNNSLCFYFLSKMSIRSTEFNFIRKFFIKILNKLLNFIKKTINLINKNDVKEILSQSTNVLISPIGIQFKHYFYQTAQRTVIIHFFKYIIIMKRRISNVLYYLLKIIILYILLIFGLNYYKNVMTTILLPH